MILAGDIGGTNTRLAGFEGGEGPLTPSVMEVYPSRKYASLDEIVKLFLATHDLKAERACFGVAGPVRQGRSQTSNLPWMVDGKRLASDLNLGEVRLLNDLEANAYGLFTLESQDMIVLNEGVPDPKGNAALISAGTGLGEAGLYREGDNLRPAASEGGHSDFAPRDDLEMALLRYLLGRYDRVSYERVLSGPGLYNIYQFLRDTDREEEPAWLAEKIRQGDPPKVISKTALEGGAEICNEALEIFVSIYGAEAGNLALKLMATGGVYMGGGIAPKIVDKLRGAPFLGAFVAKGRLRSLLDHIPVRVVMNDLTALRGAARLALLGDAATRMVPSRSESATKHRPESVKGRSLK